MKNPAFKVKVLDTVHVVLMVAAGSAAAIVLLWLVPIPKGQLTGPSIVLLSAALLVGYFVAFVTDALVAWAIRPTRERWLDAIAAAGRPATVPLDQV